MLSKTTIYSIDSSVGNELFEFWHVYKVGDIPVEHDVISHAKATLVVFIVLAFTHAIRETPARALLAIGLCNFLALRFVDQLVPTHIYEGLLIEERLFLVANHLFSRRLDTKS